MSCLDGAKRAEDASGERTVKLTAPPRVAATEMKHPSNGQPSTINARSRSVLTSSPPSLSPSNALSDSKPGPVKWSANERAGSRCCASDVATELADFSARPSFAQRELADILPTVFFPCKPRMSYRRDER